MRYSIEDRPSWPVLLLYGLQWWVASLPFAVIVGVVAARVQFPDVAGQTLYLQKMFAVFGVTLIVQILWGHRLPLVVGPAEVLLVGLLTSTTSPAAAYTSIALCGLGMAALGKSRLLDLAKCLFTGRIVSVIFILVALTCSPIILNLFLQSPGVPLANFLGGSVLAVVLFALNKALPGLWKSITLVLGLVGGSCVVFALQGIPEGVWSLSFPALENGFFLPGLEFDAGALLAFFFCFIALLTNEIGSVEAGGQMLQVEDLEGRLKRGVWYTGLSNAVCGLLGVIGCLDYALSTGVIAATGCAARRTMIPCGVLLILCALIPGVMGILLCIPMVIMASLLLYLMVSLFASGLEMLTRGAGVGGFYEGVTVAFPLMLALLVSYAPAQVWAGCPEILKPVVANGFVMGTIAVLFLEHTLCRKKGT